MPSAFTLISTTGHSIAQCWPDSRGLVDRRRVVADVGCGTGATSRMLADLGLDVLGIDLSPNMIAEARRRNPDLSFQVGSMTDIDLADSRLDGICAWYSVIHVPDELLPDVFSEFPSCAVSWRLGATGIPGG